jgi:hypothetical protein
MNETEVAQRFATLLDRYAGRIPDDVLADIRGWDSGGEYGEALSNLVACLAQAGVSVTAAERDELAALAEATGEGSEYVAKLTVSA